LSTSQAYGAAAGRELPDLPEALFLFTISPQDMALANTAS
jgi:hypothetical protein